MTTTATTKNPRQLARELLTIAPQVLRENWRLFDGADGTAGEPARTLLGIVERCADGGTGDEAEAQRLLDTCTALPSPVPDAAAWNALLDLKEVRQPLFDALLGDIVTTSAAPYPLLTELFEQFTPCAEYRSKDIDILSCQHILGSILPQYAAIRDLLPRARFWEIIGKPYSANTWAIRSLEEYGFRFNPESARLPDRQSDQSGYRLGTYQQRHRQVVRSSVRRFFNMMPASLKSSEVPILVIDDGGALIDAVGMMAKECGTSRPIVCVEQTQRGLYAAHPVSGRRNAPPGGLAVVNVAQSLSKLALESPLVAQSVIENLDSWLELLNARTTEGISQSSLRYGIIGFGSVGESIANELRVRGTPAEVYDLNHNRRAAAKRQGYEVALSVGELLDKATIIVAATAGSWLDEPHAARLHDGVIIASASSGDTEFRGLPLWKSDQLPILDSSLPNQLFDTIHGEMRFRRPDGATIHILNGGFPVNFNGALDPIEPERIQLTRALMLAGVLQAIGFKESEQGNLIGKIGIFDLEDSLDRYLSDAYDKVSALLDR
jgi:hypothetical protein